ncbi:hypothetical protein C7974DRAFT_473554 [Boeremia exigua]|uniref:uncharacterized protein n=1 Tax=Boeremia exigua TaxID=749465 RepID=UPI001E8CD783|nr:uncharacterized protein C7974DRAFT_473554 [Boeremia exigua]KAH6622201.1 hypothetical protein C7974DRAFT_473554 [Boeremia exigua]
MGFFQRILVTAGVLSLALHPALAMPEPTPAPELHTLEKRACSADNCLRAVRRNVLSAIPFCSTYTTEATATIPTWAANCQDNPTRVSSACSCLATAPLVQVYGPTDDTRYTIWEQADNIRSRPETWEEALEQCSAICLGSGSTCQSFSLTMMPGYLEAPGAGLALCYFYMTLFQPDKVTVALNHTRNVVFERV